MTQPFEPLLGYVGQVFEAGVHHGGLLVMTLEGDPVDFVYSAPVSLTHLQRILLGKRADAYVVAKVLAKPLWDKAQEKPTVLCFDEASLLGRSVSLPAPAVVLAPPTSPRKEGDWRWMAFDDGQADAGAWLQSTFADHVGSIVNRARKTMAPIDLKEPFRQLRDAIAEVRKDGQAR